MTNYQNELQGHLSKGLIVQSLVEQGKCNNTSVTMSEKEKKDLICNNVKPLSF